MKLYSSGAVRLLTISVLLAVSWSRAQAELVSGKVDHVIGDATLIKADGQSEKITTSSLIPCGSQVETGSGGRVAVTWMPGASSVITEKTQVDVTSLTYSEENGVAHRKVVLTLDQGAVFSTLVHEDANNKSDFRIKTPKAVVLAKGCVWKVSVDGEAVSASVTEDSVSVLLPNGLTVTVNSNYTFSVSEHGKPVALTTPEIREIAATLDFIYDVLPRSLTAGFFQTGLKPPLDERPFTAASYLPPVHSTSP